MRPDIGSNMQGSFTIRGLIVNRVTKSPHNILHSSGHVDEFNVEPLEMRLVFQESRLNSIRNLATRIHEA